MSTEAAGIRPEGTAESTQNSEVVRARRPPLAFWLFLAALGADMFTGTSQYLGIPISPDRLLFPAAIVLLLVDARRTHALKLLPVHWLMGLFVIWTILSMVWVGNILSGSAEFALLDRTVMPFLLFSVAPLFFVNSNRRKILLVTLTAIGFYLSITAIGETVAPSLVFPRFIMNPSIGLHYGRARGPFLSGEGMGVALGASAFAAGVLASRLNGLQKWAASFVAALSAFGVVLSLTRSVWIGFAAGGLLAFLLEAETRRWLPRAGLVLVIVAPLSAILLPAQIQDLIYRGGQMGPIYDRLASNDAAIGVIRDLPLTGLGWRKFYPLGADWAHQTDAYPLNAVIIEVHNVVLSRAAELGLPAAAVFVAVIVAGPIRALWRRAEGDLRGWRIMGVAVFAMWLIAGMFGPMAIPYANNVVWLVAGVVAVPIGAVGREGRALPRTEADAMTYEGQEL